MKRTVAYLGPAGTFTHEATRAFFPEDDVELVEYPSIPDVLDAVDAGQCDYGVVPVENAIEGSVVLTLDWLIHQVDVLIVGELVYPITQCLLVHPFQAGRCPEEWTRGDFPPPGGGSVSTVPARTPSRRRGFFCREHGGGRPAGEKPSRRGLGGHRNPDAGELDGLHVLEEDVQDHPAI